MSRCPSELGLETYLFAPGPGDVETHLAGCASCRERVAEMQRQGEDFRQFVYPRTVAAVEEAVRADRDPWRRMIAVLVPAGGLAAIAAMALLLVPAPPSSYLGAKGSAMSLQAWAGEPAGAREVADGAAVPAASPIRFRVVTSRACHLWIVSVDGTGSVSRIFPPQGEPALVQPGAGALPGGAVLDGLGGPERLYAVCSPVPVALADVESAARAAGAGGPESVRRAATLAGMPEGVTQSSLLIEKVP